MHLKGIESMSEISPAKPCPICSKPRKQVYTPFCSKRCADIDLNKWLTGRYAIPVDDEDDDSKEIPNNQIEPQE
jgi:uncharacterized protein